MEKNRVLELEKTALEVRKDVVRMIGLSKAPSLASSLSVVDILVFLYFFFFFRDVGQAGGTRLA